jgi:hypothetical protein
MTNSSGTHHKYKGEKSIRKMSKVEKKKFFMRQNLKRKKRELKAKINGKWKK